MLRSRSTVARLTVVIPLAPYLSVVGRPRATGLTWGGASCLMGGSGFATTLAGWYEERTLTSFSGMNLTAGST